MDIHCVDICIEGCERRIKVLKSWLSTEGNLAPIEVRATLQIELKEMENGTLPFWEKHKEDILQRQRLRNKEVEHEAV